MNLDDVARELGNACTNRVTGVRKAFDYVPKKITPPAVIIALGKGDHDETFDLSMTVEWTVLVVIGASDAANAQTLLRDFAAPSADVSPKSLKAAIETDPTLNGTVTSVVVKGWGEPIELDIASTHYAAVPFEVETID